MCANRDEEFARQIQATTSPVQPLPVSHHQNITQMDEVEQYNNSFDASISPTINPMAMFQPNDSYFPLEPQTQSSLTNMPDFSMRFCPKCGQGQDGDTTACWRCFESFPTGVPSQTQNHYPTLTPLQIQQQAYLQQQQRQAQFNAQHAAQQEALQQQQQLLLQRQQRMLQQLQHQPMQQSPLSQPAFQHQFNQLVMPQQPINVTRSLPWAPQPQKQQQPPSYSMSFGFSGTGTTSSPIIVDDSLPQSKPLINSLFPPITLPSSIPLVNSGWPTKYPNPHGLQVNDPTGFLRHMHHQRDHSYGNPTSDEIKDLLANIRPDEEFKVEDKDAIIPGLAKHMRLMKHQQV